MRRQQEEDLRRKQQQEEQIRRQQQEELRRQQQEEEEEELRLQVISRVLKTIFMEFCFDFTSFFLGTSSPTGRRRRSSTKGTGRTSKETTTTR